jgi:hypothetical protein
MRIAIILFLAAACGLSGFVRRTASTPQPLNVQFRFVYDTTAYAAGNDTVGYRPGTRVDWADFKGAVPEVTDAVANSSVGMKFSADFLSNEDVNTLTVTGVSYFIKSKSWVKPGKQSDYILRHEQLHFDIARLGAERFRELMSAEAVTEDNFNVVFRKIYKQVWMEHQALQQQYDRETRHSINTTEQLRWNEKIASKLSAIR